MNALPDSFYVRSDVTRIAKDLVGKVLVSTINGQTTSGLIVETEAYSYQERGCHAFNSRMTERNQVMFGAGGHAYVYLCYGVHHLFNVVTNVPGKAEAVLIRALQPLTGEPVMMTRMNAVNQSRITSGPGKLTKALGIDRTLNGATLRSSELWIEMGEQVPLKSIVVTTRIGIDYAGKDARLPWRFYWRGNEWISRP
ncbi:MAG: DNA-3-methyladenine glycosylase [Cyclobacteriaceae bacterium]|nr:DNA-3-methyladenine glycosylase [Cyclobacteriaceae bacterium]